MVATVDNQYIHARVLKFNVGFLIAESAGFSRDVSLDIPKRLRLSEDTSIEHLSGDLRLTRTSQGILVQGRLECTNIGTCCRCLEDTPFTCTLEFEELFALSPQINTPFMVADDNSIDLAPLVREETIITMPTQQYCKPDCKGLCKNCGQNFNEGTCDCVLEDTDPRWAALEALQQQLKDHSVE